MTRRLMKNEGMVEVDGEGLMKGWTVQIELLLSNNVLLLSPKLDSSDI